MTQIYENFFTAIIWYDDLMTRNDLILEMIKWFDFDV